jgi:hypothetical protein
MPYSNRYARSYRTSYAAPSNGAWKLRPASEQQVNFTLRLQNEKECEAFTPAALNQMNQGTISELIDQLKAAPRRAQPAAASVVLDFAPMIRIFRHAAEHLKYPKVRLQTPNGTVIILSLAGPRSRHAGGIYVKGEGTYPDAPYYGCIASDGSHAISNPQVLTLLQRFSADPAGVASEYGRLHGRCCFCNLPLNDERSTAVGYGPVCADHYNLPWGTERTDLAMLAS